jgi:hypothetical protein
MKAVYASRVVAGMLLLALATSFAQNGTPSVLRWAEGAPNAISDVKNDNKIEGLKADTVHIFVSLADLKETEYNRVWVQISNHSKSPIDFNPESAVLLKGDKSLRPETPEKTAHTIQKVGEAKSQELSSAHCNQVGSLQCQPTNTQMQMSKQVAQFSNQQAQWARDNGLKQTSVAPGNEVQGSIFFRKDKKSADYILRIPVGDQVFEFPVSAQNKAPSYD